MCAFIFPSQTSAKFLSKKISFKKHFQLRNAQYYDPYNANWLILLSLDLHLSSSNDYLCDFE